MPVSTQPALPFVLEDRTGLVSSSDYDDIYDRLSLRVTEHPSPPHSPDGTPQRVLFVYDMPQRWSRRTARLHEARSPVAVLHFGPHETLGTIELALDGRPRAMPMAKYLPKTSMFGGYVLQDNVPVAFPDVMYSHRSLNRQFVGADGRKYRWSFRSSEQHEWVVRAHMVPG